MSDNPRAGLFKKIAQVMEESKRIPKNGYNDFHKYHYATEADVADHLRDILVKVGLAHTLTVTDVEREEIASKDKDGKEKVNFMSRVWCEFSLWDTETGEGITSRVAGESLDSGDKGLYKGYTGAEKYFLMKTFLIPTGDDPELVGAGDGGAGKTVQRTYSAPTPAPRPQPVQAGQQQPSVHKPSEAQLKRLFAITKTANLHSDTIKDYIKQMWDIDSSKDLTLTQYNTLCSKIEAGEIKDGPF